MSISSQLASLKTSVTNVFDINVKSKKSLINEDGSSIGRAEAHQNCKKEYLKLCKLDSRFTQFENLYSEETIDMVPQLLQDDQLNAIKKQVKLFLCLVTPYLETHYVIGSIEWLIYKFEIHLHQPEDILMSCLPYHNQKIFIKFTRLLNLKKKEFSWLKHISKEGISISNLDLSSLCLKHPDALEMICSWPIQIVESTNNDENACKELCHVIISLGINILDKVKLLGDDKIEKYISPFVRIIVDGLNTTHANLNSTSVILLVYFSEVISLDRNFLNLSIKRILKNGTSNMFFGLRAIVDVCYFQQLTLKPKLQRLFTENLERLSEKERIVIAQLVAENSDVSEETIASNTTLMEVDAEECKPKAYPTKSGSRTVKEITKSLSIEWDSVDIELEVIGLLKTFILNWVEVDNRHECKPAKIALAILKLIKRNVKEPKIIYRPAGVVSHMCLALLYPDTAVRKVALHLIKLFANQWPRMKDFGSLTSNDIENDPDCLVYGTCAEVVLKELNTLVGEKSAENGEMTSLTETVACLSLINQTNITVVSELSHTWSLFLEQIRPRQISEDRSSYVLREAVTKSLMKLQSGFHKLNNCNRQTIMDIITGGIARDGHQMSCATEYLCLLPLSSSDMLHLLKNVSLDVVDANSDNKRKSLKKFKGEPTMCNSFFSEQQQDKFNVVLAAISRNTSFCAQDFENLIDPIASILGRIVTHLSMNKLKEGDETCVDSNIVDLTTNLMSAMLTIFTALHNEPPTVNIGHISHKIRLEVFSKCLYLFPNSNLNELTLLVIQKIVKLGLGQEQFNLIYFLSWIGNHLVPREDRHSLDILGNIINETLPLCIKQKRDNSCDKVQIIVKFIHESATLPKHRVLLLFQSIVNSLGGSLGVLWIQLLFMAAIKSNSATDGQNECLIRPLLAKFTMGEQIVALSAIISFLSHIIHDPSRKRKFLVDNGISNSPMNKKRKTTIGDEQSSKSVIISGTDDDFLSVKENLLSVGRKVDSANLLRTMLHHCQIHLTESAGNLLTAGPDLLKDFISSMFVSMKQIGRSNLPNVSVNEHCHSLRQIVECVGASLSRNSYLSMIADLAINDSDSGVKSKCVELLSNKLSAMVISKRYLVADEEIRTIARSIVPLVHGIITGEMDSPDWSSSMICVSSLVALGFATDDVIGESCDSIFNHLATPDFLQSSSVEKIVIVNIFFKNFVDADCYNELTTVFSCALSVVTKCVSNEEFNNGQLESALALLHAIISREDAHSVGWPMLGQLLANIFEVVSIDTKIRKLSRQSCDYQKHIRIKLANMVDTNSLIATCIELTESGIAKNNLTFISGSVSLFGCHLAHLNKMHSRYAPSEEQYEVMWGFVCRSLSLNEALVDGTPTDDVREISIKALNQLCHLFELDHDIFTRLFLWAQKTDLSPSSYLHRHITLFKFLHQLVVRSNNSMKVIDSINNSDFVSCASSFLKQLSGDMQTKSKRRKTTPSSSSAAFAILFAGNQLLADCAPQCVELIKSICDGLRALLNAENKCGMNMSISDETIELIGNVCKNMLSIDQSVGVDEYRTVTEKHMIPLIVQIATNSCNDEALLTPLAMGLCKHFTELSSVVHLAVLKALVDLKTCLGNTFDMSIKDNVSSFLEDCKLHDDERIADLANEISCGY